VLSGTHPPGPLRSTYSLQLPASGCCQVRTCLALSTSQLCLCITDWPQSSLPKPDLIFRDQRIVVLIIRGQTMEDKLVHSYAKTSYRLVYTRRLFTGHLASGSRRIPFTRTATCFPPSRLINIDSVRHNFHLISAITCLPALPDARKVSCGLVILNCGQKQI
jgi:hypothetical protein